VLNDLLLTCLHPAYHLQRQTRRGIREVTVPHVWGEGKGAEIASGCMRDQLVGTAGSSDLGGVIGRLAWKGLRVRDGERRLKTGETMRRVCG
jgi:hypothetical protein